MGPNDPFGGAALREAPSAPKTATPSAQTRPSFDSETDGSATYAIRVGFGVGVATGLLALLTSFPDALAVLGLGVLGAAFGAAIQTINPFRFNLRAAAQALLGRE